MEQQVQEGEFGKTEPVQEQEAAYAREMARWEPLPTTNEEWKSPHRLPGAEKSGFFVH